MKTETKQWLDKITPLLVHLKEGGEVKYKDDGKLYHNTSVPYFCLLTRPDLYSVHVEPQVVYVNEYNDGSVSHPFNTACGALDFKTSKNFGGYKRTIRFVEDTTWKPPTDKSELDNDHHLPDHNPPHVPPLSKQASDYMKTV